MKSRRKRGGMALTGNPAADENLHEIAKNEKIIQSLGGARRTRRRKKARGRSYRIRR